MSILAASHSRPDGNYIYFLKSVDKEGSEGSSDLYRAPVFGGTPQVLVRNINTAIAFSPDGKRMAYVRINTPDVGKFQMLISGVDGAAEKMIQGGPLAAETGRCRLVTRW